MHEAVTKSSTATKVFFPSSSDDLLAPISLTNRSQAADSIGWAQNHDSDGEPNIENWHLSSNDSTPPHLAPPRRAPPAGLQKLAFPMPSRADNPLSADILADRAMNPGHRWRFNTNGQLVDAEAASAGWDLADEIVRLKIGEVAGEPDDVHGHIRTPPKSKLASAAVAQLTETSPLDTSSNTSVGSSPHASDHQISISHSRGSSTDTTMSSSQESSISATSNTLLTHPALKGGGPANEVKERPHSFSGGLSSADLRRLQQAGDETDRQLQQQQWAQYRDNAAANMSSEQLSYPSLANHSAPVHRPQPQHPQLYDYRSGATQANQTHVPNRDELQIDYDLQQRNYNSLAPGQVLGANESTFVPGRPNNNIPGLAYRQPPRGFPQQNMVPSPSTLGYPGGHTSHLSLGNTQQLYDMMLPGLPHERHHPAVARVQQQHNVFRGTHHHSASDPSSIRDAANLALLNGAMQPFAPGMFQQAMPPPPPSMPLYPNQFYGAQEAYSRPDVATAQAMAARLQSQYTGSYGLPPQGMGMDGGVPSPTSTTGQNGPSANNRKLGLYKTELCRSWEEKGTCRYGAKCQFAHGEDELRNVSRHPKYKTEICRTFWVSGSCPYGKRCCFIHTELPQSGMAPPASATDSAPPPSRPDGRARSLSTNSDPNEGSSSLLARISAKRNQEPGNNNSSTPIDMNSNNGVQFTRPPTGSLRVVTSLDGPPVKQNKSAYPSFASNGILLPAPDHVSVKSPAPVTAGPDLGRHNNSRMEIVGYNNNRVNKAAASSIRHSFNGTEVDLNFSSSPPVPSASYAISSGDGNGHTPRANGHVRAGSAGNWGSFSRSSHLSTSSYPHASSPAGDAMVNSPWSTTELAMGSSRLHEKAWA